MNNVRHFTLAMLLVLMVSLSAAVAQTDADPPGRAVAISYLSGQVSVQPGGVNDWVDATINRPLTSADRVWADQNSRAELNMGTAILRVDSETSVTLLNVDDQTAQIELDQGALNLHLTRLYDGQIYEVDTPNLAFTVTKPGDYRFDVDPNNDTTMVTVWKGDGQATGQGNAVRIGSGERASFNNGTSLDHQISGAPAPDGFDDWCRVRDQRLDRSISARYVSPDVVGYEDLDDYGTWRTVPTYGAIWVPAHVEAGWAPYRYGHWVWIDPWGWTWVDDAPWGFAPCHYGRWVYTGGYWGWAPGPVAVRPVYAPALVAWAGGSNWGVGVSFGGGPGVGWFPLGYGDPYIPAYHVSRGYFERVNVSNTRITNITYVTNNYYNNAGNVTRISYVNRRVPGAMTAVSASVMVNSQPVGRSFVRLPVGAAEHVQVGVIASVAPSRTSVLGIHAGVRAAAPAHVAIRPVVYHTAPPPRPVPFEAKQQVLARQPGRPLDPQAESQLRARMPQQAPSHSPNPGAFNPNANRNVNPGERNAAQPAEHGANMNQRQPVANPSERTVPRPPEREATPENRPSESTPPAGHEEHNNPRPGSARPGEQPQAQQPRQMPEQRQAQPPQRQEQQRNENTPRSVRPSTPRPPQGQGRPQNESRPQDHSVPRPPAESRSKAAPKERKQESKPEKRNDDHHDRGASLQRGASSEHRRAG
jgi:Family of unknown function (DUF6600)